MKHNEIILRNQAHPRLTAAATTHAGNGTSMLYIDTGPGYIELGPGNSSHCHIQTDRTNFYFNKELRVDSGIVGSYDEDLILRRANNSSHQITVTTTEIQTPLSLDLGGILQFTSDNHELKSERSQNIELKTGAGSAGGLLLRNTSAAFLAQLYGDGTNYGFLDAVWGGWDIRKVTNGKLYLNGDNTYFLQPEAADSAKFFRFVQIGDSSSYGTNSGTWGARLNVTDDVHSKIVVAQDADSMESHWYAHTGHTSIKFGTNSSHDVEFQRAGSTSLEIEAGGLMTMVPIRRNSHHASGFLEGSYNNVGGNENKSNPIYTIGSNYNPVENGLSNMYGIGYTYATNASFISMGGASGWGLYVAADGDARIFLDGSNGHISTTGEHYAGNGAAATPSYSFINDTNTGMYRYTTDQIGFATAGTHRMSIDSTGLRLSTGYYIAQSTTESTILKSATSTNLLQLRNSSNTLHGGVYGSGTEIGILDKDNQWAIRHIADSRTYFYINNSERVHIDNDGLDIVQGSLMMSGQHAMREATYSGTGNIGTSGAWYTLCYITENATPAYISLKFNAHSTQTFVVTTGYHGSNVASIQMLSGTWTQNGAYPGASAVRILKDSSNNYRFQLQLTYSSGPTGFALYARAWGGTPVNDIVNFESSLTVDTTTGSTIDSLNTSFTGSGSSRSHKGPNGSVASPSYGFHQDSDTGMYLNGTGNIGFASGGTTRAQITGAKLELLGGTGLDLQTSSGNVRGLIGAFETIPHLRIATSSNESIGFYDGGTSGVENIRIEGSGHLNLYTGNLKINDITVIDNSRNATFQELSAASSLVVHSNGRVTINQSSAPYSDLEVGGAMQSNRLFLVSTGDAALNSVTHAFQIGPASSLNLIMDQNELMARNNGSASDLHLNADGGNITFRNNGTGTTNLTMSGQVFLDHNRNAFFTSTRVKPGSFGNYFEGESANSTNTVINLGYTVPYGGRGHLSFGGTGLQFYTFMTTRYVGPCNDSGVSVDDTIDLGSTGSRFDDVYATNGTIQTSDQNEKQDIQELTEAEARVAVACKGLIRRFRWISSVEEKGDDARYHFGAIAQDVEAAFIAEGLDAGDYGLFIRSTWWEHEGEHYPTAEAAPTGAVEKTRLGIRYNQLLAFIISAL